MKIKKSQNIIANFSKCSFLIVHYVKTSLHYGVSREIIYYYIYLKHGFFILKLNNNNNNKNHHHQSWEKPLRQYLQSNAVLNKEIATLPL